MSYDIRKWAENGVRNQPRRPWVGRILIVLIVVAVGYAMAATAGAFGTAGRAAPPFVLLIFGIAAASPFGRSNLPLWGRTDALDEFERAALDRANRVAYAVVGGGVLAGLGWLALAGDHGLPVPGDAHGWNAWFHAAGAAVLALPTAIGELTTPIPPADPDDDRI